MARVVKGAKKSMNKNLTTAAKFVRGIDKQIASSKKILGKLVTQMDAIEKSWNRLAVGAA